MHPGRVRIRKSGRKCRKNGVEAASHRYFGETAADLDVAEAGRIAAIIPSPLKWKATRPGPYVRRRTGSIEARSGTVARGGLADCVFD